MSANASNEGGDQRDPNLTARDVTSLKEWISKRPDLPQNHEDKWLGAFLWGREYSLEKCKATLENYYTVRVTMPDIFSGRDPTSETMKNTKRDIAMCILPKFSPNGSVVALCKLLDGDPDNIDIIALAKRVSMMGDYLLYKYERPINLIIDLKGITMGFTLKIPIQLAKDGVYCLQEVYPLKIKKIIIINPPGFIEIILKLFLPFMSNEVRETICVMENVDDLYKIVPQDMLPNEYGGNAGSVRNLNDDTQTILEDDKDWFLNEAQKKRDESKFVGGSIGSAKSGNVFGTGGSFRSLNVD